MLKWAFHNHLEPCLLPWKLLPQQPSLEPEFVTSLQRLASALPSELELERSSVPTKADRDQQAVDNAGNSRYSRLGLKMVKKLHKFIEHGIT